MNETSRAQKVTYAISIIFLKNGWQLLGRPQKQKQTVFWTTEEKIHNLIRHLAK